MLGVDAALFARARLMARNDVDQKAVAARLKQARQIAALTQKQVAERTGLSERAYQNYEQFRVPRGKALERVSQVLNVKPYWILWGDDPSGPMRLEQIEANLDELGRQIRSETMEMRRLLEQVLRRLDEPPESDRA